MFSFLISLIQGVNVSMFGHLLGFGSAQIEKKCVLTIFNLFPFLV